MVKWNNSDYNLIVVAHPDDETLYFSSILQDKKTPCHVLCMTDGNADGHGDRRKQEFIEALSVQGCESWSWGGLADIYEQRLQEEEVEKVFDTLTYQPSAIFTHGVVGEYMHPHHQDVSYFVHKYWIDKPIYSVSYNTYPEKIMTLSSEQYRAKCKALIKTYGLETQRFLNFLPGNAIEQFCQLEWEEVEEVYLYISHRKVGLDTKVLKQYRWFASFLELYRQKQPERPF